MASPAFETWDKSKEEVGQEDIDWVHCGAGLKPITA